MEEQEKALLSLIDKYNKEREIDRQYFLKHRKNNPDSGLNKEPFITFYKLFESKVSQIEISEFLYYFGEIRLLKTFHYSHHAESLIQRFENLSLRIPHFILECQKEVVVREDFIKSFFESEKFKWSQSQKKDFLLDVQKEAKTHSFDHKSEKEYLKKKFEETIQETRNIEKDINKRFGYLVGAFFDGENFSISKNDLNEYFYHSEIASGGCGAFLEVRKALDQYVYKKNAVFTLRGFLSSQKDSRGLEPIWIERPNNEIEYVLEKGYKLGVWDEKNQLQTKRKGLYGHGKSFLSNLYHALVGNSIKSEIHYKQIGKILCEFFSVKIGDAKEPFSPFKSGNPKQIDELKKSFRLK